MAKLATERSRSTAGGRSRKAPGGGASGAAPSSSQAGDLTPGSAPAPATAAGAGEDRKLRQAVVVVHGMGEQLPMSTLRSFVESVWVKDPQVPVAAGHPNGAKVWITPDRRTGSLNLRRIVTAFVGRPSPPAAPDEPQVRLRTDFYELYWADLTQGTTRARLYAWVMELLRRDRRTIPPDAMPIYRVTMLLVAFFGLVLVLAALSSLLSPWLAVAVTVLAGLFTWAVDRILLPFYGDVAGYARATPQTFAQRACVRERGLKLLRDLSDDDDYDRIVLVGHSLGSIIAYDLLQFLWNERRPRALSPSDSAHRAIGAVTRFTRLAGSGGQEAAPDLDAYRSAQWNLYRALREPAAERASWKISDFVTLGSPLTHAEFLLVDSMEELRQAISERQFSTSPPQSDSATKRELVYESEPGELAMHFAACFSATRWTNVYDVGDFLVSGDPFSGSMRENFGWGIKEFQVEMRRRRRRWQRFLTHTLYWSEDVDASSPQRSGPQAHIRALRDGLDLFRSEGGTP
jgi:hypothetical protein